MNKEKIIEDVLREYSFLMEDGGINDQIDQDVLFTAIENLGYAEYFSNQKLYENVKHKNKFISDLKGKKFLSDDDIDTLKMLVGPKWMIIDEELKSLDLNTVEVPDNFPGTESDPRHVTMDQMEGFLLREKSQGKKLKLTQSPSKVRIYAGAENLSMFFIGKGLKLYGTDFKKFLRLLDFYKAYSSDIEIGESTAAGLTSQRLQADQINDYFKKNNPDKVPFHLFIQDGPHIVDCKVSIDSAEHISSNQKADFAMKNNSKENFWVSFKAANYLDKKDRTKLASPGFEFYGPTISIGERLANDPKWKEMIVKLTKGMLKVLGNNFIDVSKKKLTFGPDPVSPSIEIITHIDGVPIAQVVNNDEDKLRYMRAKSAAISKFMAMDGLKKKLIFFTPDTFSVMMDFLDGTPVSKEIAGKAIYGVDFEFGKDKPFGRENVNILLKSKTPITVEPHVLKNKENAVLIKTDERGHVLFNPNLPLPKDMDDPILTYRPVFHPKWVQNEHHLEVVNGVGMLFLGTRIFIVPAGKAKDATVIK